MTKSSKKRKHVEPELYDHAASRRKQLIARTESIDWKARKIKQMTVRSHAVPAFNMHSAADEDALYDGITFNQDGNAINETGVEDTEEVEGLIVRTTDKAKRYLNSVSSCSDLFTALRLTVSNRTYLCPRGSSIANAIWTRCCALRDEVTGQLEILFVLNATHAMACIDAPSAWEKSLCVWCVVGNAISAFRCTALR